jgi:hypothetical protein
MAEHVAEGRRRRLLAHPLRAAQRAQHQHTRARDLVHPGAQQRERRGVRAMQIVEHEHQRRALGGEREAAHDGVEYAVAAGRDAERNAVLVGLAGLVGLVLLVGPVDLVVRADLRLVGVVTSGGPLPDARQHTLELARRRTELPGQRIQRELGVQLAQQARERPQRRRLACLATVTPGHREARARRISFQLLDHARLADAGLTRDHAHAAAARARIAQRCPQGAQHAFAPHERRSRRRRASGHGAEQRRQRTLALRHRAHEAIAAPVHVDDDLALTRLVAEQLAQPHHRHGDRVVRDDATVPDLGDQLLLGHQLTRATREAREQAQHQRLGLERYAGAT